MKSISKTFYNPVSHVTVMHQKFFFTAKFVWSMKPLSNRSEDYDWNPRYHKFFAIVS